MGGKMNKITTIFLILSLTLLVAFGCAKQDYQYPTGYATSGGQQPAGGYVGGGCAVSGPEPMVPGTINAESLAA